MVPVSAFTHGCWISGLSSTRGASFGKFADRCTSSWNVRPAALKPIEYSSLGTSSMTLTEVIRLGLAGACVLSKKGNPLIVEDFEGVNLAFADVPIGSRHFVVEARLKARIVE